MLENIPTPVSRREWRKLGHLRMAIGKLKGALKKKEALKVQLLEKSLEGTDNTLVGILYRQLKEAQKWRVNPELCALQEQESALWFDLQKREGERLRALSQTDRPVGVPLVSLESYWGAMTHRELGAHLRTSFWGRSGARVETFAMKRAKAEIERRRSIRKAAWMAAINSEEVK